MIRPLCLVAVFKLDKLEKLNQIDVSTTNKPNFKLTLFIVVNDAKMTVIEFGECMKNKIDWNCMSMIMH